MTIQTYTDLQTEIASWLHRTDLTARIPSFIQFAESRINNELRVARMVRFKTINVDGDRFDRPSDFLEMITLGPTDTPDTEFQIVSARAVAKVNGDFYAHVGDEIVVKDMSTEPRNFDLVYYAKIPCLCDAEQSWLLSDQPDIYLFGSLVFAAPFLGNDARAATWETGYQNALQSLQMRDDVAKFSGRTLEIRPTITDGVTIWP